MHARVVLGVGKGVLFREVSSVQGYPHRERERFHCIFLVRKRAIEACGTVGNIQFLRKILLAISAYRGKIAQPGSKETEVLKPLATAAKN